MPWPLGSCAMGKGRLTVVSAVGTQGSSNVYNEPYDPSLFSPSLLADPPFSSLPPAPSFYLPRWLDLLMSNVYRSLMFWSFYI
jgi:hypothetical protein